MPEPTLSGLVPRQISRIVELARRHLDMDVAYVTAFEGDQQVVRVCSGDGARFGIAPGVTIPLDETYCARVVTGELPNAVVDARHDSRVADLPVTSRLGIGSYIAVALQLADEEMYGTLCCLSHEPQVDLGPRDVRFLSMLAELVVEELEVDIARDRARHRLQRLLDTESIQVALQPIVELATGRCIGMEGLSRFPAGFGAPDVVFGAAHEAGLGDDLERLAVKTVLDLLPTLPDHVYLAINLAPSLACDLTSALPPHLDLPWHRLVLEVTEHAVIESYAELRNGLKPLRKKGLRLAIDDAGAGYASLQHVVEMRPDIIKVDRSLVDGLARDPARRSVVSGFVLLAFELGATVLAEGVETAEDLYAARRLGVSAAQGYVVDRPSLDPADHQRWAAGRNLLKDMPEPQPAHRPRK